MPRLQRLVVVVLLLSLWQTALLARSRSRQETRGRELAAGAAIARDLGLTDLAIWTEARYTRHPTLADRGTGFQDHPGSLEHFPAGSVVPPPPHLLPAGAGTVPGR